jgi:replicative DNA helicase
MAASQGDRQFLPPLPCNVEAEAVLLGTLMAGQVDWLIEYAADRLSAASFHEPVHGRIFDAILREHALGNAATPVFIKGYFEDDDGLDALGGTRYLARLTADGQGLLAPRQFVAQVKDLAARRKVMAAMLAAYQDCANLETDLAAIVSSVDAAIDQRGGDAVLVSDAAETMTAFQTELDAERFGVRNHRIDALDELMGALEPKSLTVLAARPSVGKTAVGTNYALGAARSGHGVCFVSLEMSREQIAGRLIADASFDDADRRIPYKAINERTLNPWQRERVNDLAKLIGKLPLNIVDASALTMGRLERIVRSQKRAMAARGLSLDLVVVDYLQLLHCDERKRSIYEAISEISSRLKELAKSNQLAVLALAQLSRSVEARTDKRPTLADLRDSGQIEQDADTVLFLMREEHTLRQSEPRNDPDEHDKWQNKLNRCLGTIDFILAKRRSGSIGTAQGKFYGSYQAVR